MEKNSLGYNFSPSTVPPSPRNAVLSLAEKTIATYLQAFIVALLGSQFFESLDWSTAQSLAIATIPAALTVIANALGASSIPMEWPPLVQGAARTVRTAAASFLGYLIAAPMFSLDRSMWVAAGAAAGTAFLAAVKAELGVFIGDRGSVAWLPAAADPYAYTASSAA